MQRWGAIVRSAVDAIVLVDARGCIEEFNPAAERLFGYTPEEIFGRSVAILVPESRRAEYGGYARHYAATGERMIRPGTHLVGACKDGTTFPLQLTVGEAEVDGARAFIAIIHDLTEQLALEERLRTSEARWRSVIESAVDGIVVIDASGRIEVFNPAAERLFGYAEAEVYGRNISILMPSPYREEHDGYISRYFETGEKRIIGIGREVTGLRRDGTTFPVRLSVGEMHVNGERKFTGILADLSARVRMEERLREQTSLARLGEMAAVIAHEVKNPLAGIRGAIQVIGGRLPSGSKDAEIATEIVTRIDALNELIKDLLLFARPPVPRPLPVDLGELVRTTADLLTGDPALTRVAIQVEGHAAPVMADPELLKIAFQNLLVNGAQAMHGHGTIRVTLDTIESRCRVVVADAGPGIAADVLERIFTPFFTTKARGTGLGLPTAKRIVEAHDGRIAIACPPGGGTAVTVELPAAPAIV
ncbi:MAG TPA: PAS domain S-box protein [Vicinamibacterales bacterium]|nr:PAS domain S-box protein [Vicinamibacterales bacterium]